MSDQKSQEGCSFNSPFGLKEEDFVRTVAQGKYTPTAHEFEDLILEKKVTFNEFRVLIYIKTKTINFWKTHTRLRRKDIAAALELDRGDTFKAIKSLVGKGYILEKEHMDSYYFYGINPQKFNGVIIMRSKTEAKHRLNVVEKKRLGIYEPKASGKNPLVLWEKAINFVGKHHKEDEIIVRNYSAFQLLKYILLKYTLLNSISDARAIKILEILEATTNADFMIKQFVALLQKQPMHAGAIVEELLRADREKKDGQGRSIRTNAVAYLITGWDGIKHHYQSFHHKMNMSEEAIQRRKEIAELIAEYPIETNVILLKKTEILTI
jgi:hypothetical protein